MIIENHHQIGKFTINIIFLTLTIPDSDVHEKESFATVEYSLKLKWATTGARLI